MMAYSAITCNGTMDIMINSWVYELIIIVVGVSSYDRELGILARPFGEYATCKYGIYVYK